jgi:hypothetical protein
MVEFHVGQEFLVFEDPDKKEEFYSRVKEVEKELKTLPKGNRYITFYMTRDYKRNFSPNTRILYKEVVRKIDRVDGHPHYKPHFISIRQGRIRTSNPEEIAFLDMKKGFVRAEDRELSPLEKEKMELQRIKEEKNKAIEEILAMRETIEKQKKELRKIKSKEESKKDDKNTNGKKKDS